MTNYGDHLTAEERAVIETAMQFRAVEEKYKSALRSGSRTDSLFKTRERRRIKFELACSALSLIRSTPPLPEVRA